MNRHDIDEALEQMRVLGNTFHPRAVWVGKDRWERILRGVEKDVIVKEFGFKCDVPDTLNGVPVYIDYDNPERLEVV